MTKFLIAVKFYCNQSTGGEGAELSCGGANNWGGGLTTEVEGLSPPRLLTLTTAPGSTAVQWISDFHFLTLGANPWAKVHQTWRRPTAGPSPPSCTISARWHKRSTRWSTKIFHFLARVAKVRQKGRWHTYPGLAPCQISSPCVNPRWIYPLQNICRQTTADRQTETNSKRYIDPQHAYQHVGITKADTNFVH